MSKSKKRFKLPWLTLTALLLPLALVAVVMFRSQDSHSSLPKFYEKIALPSSFYLKTKQNMKPGPVDGGPVPVEWRYAYTSSESTTRAKQSVSDAFTKAGCAREDAPGDNMTFRCDKAPKDLGGEIELRATVYEDNSQTYVTVNVSGMEM